MDCLRALRDGDSKSVDRDKCAGVSVSVLPTLNRSRMLRMQFHFRLAFSVVVMDEKVCATVRGTTNSTSSCGRRLGEVVMLPTIGAVVGYNRGRGTVGALVNGVGDSVVGACETGANEPVGAVVTGA